MEWKEVSYSKSNASVPSERWGHRMVCTKSNQLVLFGGFGGSPLAGRYLGEVWSFSIATCAWQQFATAGRIPQSRSNYTLHYDAINNNIILFGGSCEQKIRSNSISVLSWTRKEWTQHQIAASSEVPWERTYHSSEYRHPYLIIYGGEGVFGEDLDDMWAFNVQSSSWNRLAFNESDKTPKKRRFHSTALLNHHFYLMGGCNESYVVLDDMYRVDLSQIFEKQQFGGLTWECVHEGHQILHRWGHSSLVYDSRIYIVGGKISGNTDCDFGASFDPATQQLAPLAVHQTTVLPSRRRQASAIVGNSLLIFGGFNGKYMNDFYYLALGESTSVGFQCLAVGDRNSLLQEIQKQQQKCKGDMTIKLARNGKVEFLLKSQRSSLQNNEFFANLMKFSPEPNLFIELPHFCDVTAFRVVHLSLTQKQILICPKFSIKYLISLALTYEYFVCRKEIQAFGSQLCRVVNEENCLQLLQTGTELGMQGLQRSAAQVYFLNHEGPPKRHRSSVSTTDSNLHTYSLTFEQINRPENEPENPATLEEVYETIRFDVEQKRLKGRGGLLSRFKAAFMRQSPEVSSAVGERGQESSQRGEMRRKENSSGCFLKLIAFLAGICESSENRRRQQPPL